jgi:hypothetical protein
LGRCPNELAVEWWSGKKKIFLKAKKEYLAASKTFSEEII